MTSNRLTCSAGPGELAVGCDNGLFSSGGGGQWSNLTSFLPRPRSTITYVAIDCEAIYVSTDARSILRILNYKSL
jgi:hypothetical protein